MLVIQVVKAKLETDTVNVQDVRYRGRSNMFCHLNKLFALSSEEECKSKKIAVTQIFVRTQSREVAWRGLFVSVSCAGRSTVFCCMFPLV